jgi:NAD(P)-dependent dehydrogenase (short-subunit alcohol dehydrogenase family)
MAAALELGVVGMAAAVGAVLPHMQDAGRGTLLFTTGSAAIRPNAQRATSAVANAAQGMYIKMLHEALAPVGIHALHAVIVGPIGADGGHDPDAIADVLWRAHVERDGALAVIDAPDD